MQNQVFRILLGSYPSKAIKLLYDRYYYALIRVASKYTGDVSAAEDVVQETFSFVWENHKQLSKYHETSIQAYLIKVVRTKSILSYRRSKSNQKKNRVFTNEFSRGTLDKTIEHTIIEHEREQQLHQIIQTFPPKERECLMLKLNYGLGPDEIALRMNVTRKAVERSLTSARKRLRKIYTEMNK